MSYFRGRMIGFFSKMLRKHGFTRAKRKPVFFRHTIGLGGIYVELVPGGAILRCPELQMRVSFNCVSRLKDRLDSLEELESGRAPDWKRQILQYDSHSRIENQLTGMEVY